MKRVTFFMYSKNVMKSEAPLFKSNFVLQMRAFGQFNARFTFVKGQCASKKRFAEVPKLQVAATP